jgi:N-acetylneuraminate synthase
MKSEFKIGKKSVGLGHPVWFIADIAANHDGDISRAKDLIYLAAANGADAAKFQHFQAATIVSDKGFKELDSSRMSHQASWKKSVFEVYQEASLNVEWTAELKMTCGKAGIEFMTSPYSFELADAVDPFVNAHKIGSGDITWHEILGHIAKKGKPVLLAAGASTLAEVKAAVSAVARHNSSLALMQCNTNYTASPRNFQYLNLNVLKTFAEEFPGVPLGLSDHTHGCASVLGAVTLGAAVIEKHFTDDNNRTGPDHKFAMNPSTWAEMVDRTRELEAALGDGVKRVEDNEKDTVVVQRRAIRAAVDIPAGKRVSREDLTCLRPCPENALPPFRINELIGGTAKTLIPAGAHITAGMII